jgi:cupin superfamily acireductone dioxygenase involved in methionine salvage
LNTIKYDGEHAKTSKRLEEIVRNASNLTNGEMIISLLDAITVLQKQEKAIQFMMNYGFGIEMLMKTMDCSKRDIVDMDKGNE